MGQYPVVLELAGRPCVVIGGGLVAERKVEGLLAAGAAVTVIAPRLTRRLRALAGDGRIRHVARAYAPGDVEGYQLAFAATGEGDVNAAVAREGRERGVLVNAADDPAHCDFTLPAVLRRGALVVAVATGGASPALAAAVRDELGRCLGPEYAELADVAAEVRRAVRRGPTRPPAGAWRRALTPDLVALLAQGRREEAKARLLSRLTAATDMGVGKVFLVGAGPGDPGLITVQGLAALRQADVVVYDRLVSPALLAQAPTAARRIFAGRPTGHRPRPQAEINAILIAHARCGRRVVRLKGGDPFVFGRGGEEAEALARAGIPFEVVPGVTSAVAVPACAGIPLTYRGLSSSFAVVTGHEAHDKDGPAVDWAALATAVDTLVVLMGARSLPRIARALVRHGRAPDTPVALIRWGTTEAQTTVIGTLADTLDPTVELEPPVVAVIGSVVSIRERLRWLDEGTNRETECRPSHHGRDVGGARRVGIERLP
jgi:uroporphyrin-III C-methyltransferase/precorrin-2 dehydrogenase/sirohydrochlorin ferrochelatase